MTSLARFLAHIDAIDATPGSCSPERLASLIAEANATDPASTGSWRDMTADAFSPWQAAMLRQREAFERLAGRMRLHAIGEHVEAVRLGAIEVARMATAG